jgi:hypothetical protein
MDIGNVRGGLSRAYSESVVARERCGHRPGPAAPDGRPIGSKTEVFSKTLPPLEAPLRNASCRNAFALCLCG